MADPIPKLDGLCKVRPKRLSSVIRLVWPDIKAAREFGHTLKFIHERLVESGVPISYNQLTVYVSRIRREESAAPSAGKRGIVTETPEVRVGVRGTETRDPEPESSGRDPLENYQGTCIQNRPGHFQAGKPDESKLI
jgi:hypothetical protein